MRRSLTAAIVMILAAGCGSSGSSSGGNAQVTNMVGVIGTATLSGSISLSIASTSLLRSASSSEMLMTSASPVTVSGTLQIEGGASVSLSGTYDPTSHALSVTGGGYSFAGTYASGILSGTFTTPTNETGSFSARPGSSNTVAAYCGAFTSQNDSGYFNIAVDLSSHAVSGIGVSRVDGGSTPLSGLVSGSDITLTYPVGQGGSGTAVGTISPTVVQGTFSSTTGDSGTWGGAPCQ